LFSDSKVDTFKSDKNEIESIAAGERPEIKKIKGSLKRRNEVKENEDFMTFEELNKAGALLDKTEGTFDVDSFMIKKNDKINDEKSEFDSQSLIDNLDDDLFKLDTGL